MEYASRPLVAQAPSHYQVSSEALVERVPAPVPLPFLFSCPRSQQQLRQVELRRQPLSQLAPASVEAVVEAVVAEPAVSGISEFPSANAVSRPVKA